MQTNDIKVKYNNKVSDNQSNPCIVVFTDITNSPDASAIAWQVIKKIGFYTFNYTFATSIQVTWNQGKSGTSILKVQDSSWLFEDTEKGFSLIETDSRATPNEFTVINKASIEGGIRVTAFKDGNPIAVKHTVAKGQKAQFIFHPKVYFAVVDDIDVGDIIYLEDLSSYTEISLEELKSVTVTLKGSLKDGYSFTVSEKIPTSGQEKIEPIDPIEPVEPIDPIKPCPPEKPSQSENTIEILVEKGKYHDLFPFIYMRNWPNISPEERQRRFVDYDGKNSPPNSLYNGLIEIKKASQNNIRFQMQQLAISFIEGKEFPDQFIPSINDIKGDIKYFAHLNSWLRQQDQIIFRQLKAKLEDVLKSDWNKFKQYLETENYKQEKDKIWQNFFALVIMLDYHPHILEEFTKILVMCNLLERIIAVAEYSNGGSENTIDDTSPKTSQEIIEAARASIILPQDLFPLPPANKGDSPSKAEAKEWVEPYAIGDLQIVRQRLLRYELGEVAQIENVLKGERKETTQRKLNRVNESLTNASADLEENETDVRGTKADLLNETLKTLAQDKLTANFDKFDTSYGPPTTVTFNGSWTLENIPGNHTKQVRQFAKDITTRTANRIARYVNQVRTLSILDEAEETVIHSFDNRNGTSNIIGIYRWVNKIYGVHVVNYGHRLMIEFFLQNPAESYIKSVLQLQGISQDEPIAPNKLIFPDQKHPHLNSYEDVTRENYPQLATMYDIQAPPAEVKIIPIMFEGGEPIDIKKISVPEGYRATSASVTYVVSDDTKIKLKGFVGKQQFDIYELPNPLLNLTMSNEDLAIPACVMCIADPILLPLPSEDSPNSYSSIKYCVNIEVQCDINPEIFKEWQIKTYNAILEEYRKQKADYYDRVRVWQAEIRLHNPLEKRKIEKHELKKACTEKLFSQYFKLVGDSDKTSGDENPSQFAVNAPRYIQFFEQAFEWNEITYHFYPHLEGQENQEQLTLTALDRYSDTDPLFTSFLQAGMARVIVPVRPDYAMLVLYYLSSGMIWPGENALTAINEEFVYLVNELKILPKIDRECNHVSKPWEITIPTSMIMLQDSSNLPHFPLIL